MSGDLSSQIRGAQLAGASYVLALAGAVMGLVWLSIWGVGFLSATIGETYAALIVALIYLAPLLIFFILKSVRQIDARAHEQDESHEALAQISLAARNLAEKSPLTALAVAALAGVLAVRFPAALTLLLQVVESNRT